ncbi:MAG: diaminopimelate epimerase [Armatimonadetes bacterium]|nr:diaminopimelate epimerase [Armatimonadota bacterium]
MSGLRFWKTQTVGNDFILLHADDVAEAGLEDDLPSVAQVLCERQFGVGSDGLLVIEAHDGALSQRMFNPDGTEDFCGNGLRCSALHASRLGLVGPEHQIEHFGRVIQARVQPDGQVSVAIGVAVYDPEMVPLNAELHPGELVEEEVAGLVGTAVNTGTTHFVAFVDELPSDAEIARIGPLVEHDSIFPERTSVIFAKPTDERSLSIRIWERGVGETLGCGTGSSAAAAVWMRRTGDSSEVCVTQPGGVLTVSARPSDGSLITASRPVEPFSGVVPIELFPKS